MQNTKRESWLFRNPAEKKARLLQKLEEGSYVNYKLAEIEI
jgi:hypothetical protein